MGTCEMCGNERISTKKAMVSNTIVQSCSSCIETMNLRVKYENPIINDVSNDISVVQGKGITGIDIMTKESDELIPGFHKKIIESRKIKNWSQQDLARRINEKINVIQKIESGSIPQDSVLKKIEKILELQLMMEISSSNNRMIGKSDSKEMTIADISEEVNDRDIVKKRKKKMRRLGVSRGKTRKRSEKIE